MRRLPLLVAAVLVLAFAVPAAAATRAPGPAVPPGRAASTPSAEPLTPGSGQYVPVAPVVLATHRAGSARARVTLAGRPRYPGRRQVSAVAVQVLAGSGTSWFDVLPLRSGAVDVRDAGAGPRVLVRGYFTSGHARAVGATFVPSGSPSLLAGVRLSAGGERTIQVSGRNGVPAARAVSAVALELTAEKPSATGSLHVSATGLQTADAALTSVRYPAGGSRTGMELTQVSPDGRITIRSSAPVTVSVRLRGWFVAPASAADTTGTTFHPAALDAEVAASVAADGTSMATLGHDPDLPAGRVRGAIVEPEVAGGPPVGADLAVASSGKVSARSALGRTARGSGRENRRCGCRGYLRAAVRPGPPVRVSAVAGDRSASVRWSPPRSDGGTAVTGYRITAEPGGRSVTAPPGATEARIDGLTNGTRYRFRVSARAAAGASSESVAAAEPEAPAPPGAPFVTDVTARDSAVRVTWSPPPGGADAVTGYVITATPGDVTVEAGPDAADAIVTGLTNGTEYTLTVAATNANGTGPPSIPSDPVTPLPAQAPMKPAITALIALDGRIDVQWVAPPDGGSPITGYTVALQPGDHVVQIPAGTTVAAVSGLDNGTQYTATVVATNAAGDGEPGTGTATPPRSGCRRPPPTSGPPWPRPVRSGRRGRRPSTSAPARSPATR